MFNRIHQLGLFVAFSPAAGTPDPQAHLQQMGLFVVHEAIAPVSQSKLRQMGLMVVHKAAAPDSEPVLIQGEEIRRDYTLQGQELTNSAFFGLD